MSSPYFTKESAMPERNAPRQHRIAYCKKCDVVTQQAITQTIWIAGSGSSSTIVLSKGKGRGRTFLHCMECNKKRRLSNAA